MALNIIPVTVLARGSNELATPELAWYPFNKLEDIDVSTLLANRVRFSGEQIDIAEHPMALEALTNMNSTDPEIVKYRSLGQTGNLAIQATGTAIAKFLTEFTTVTGTSAEAATLDAAVVGKVRKIINNDANTDLLLFPAVGQYHKGLAINLSITVAFGTTAHLYCKTTGVWTRLVDNG